jgi:hypothetical protein
MRALGLLVLVCGAAAAQDFRPATVLAKQVYQRQKSSSTHETVQIGNTWVEMNLLTVVLDGYEITCAFETAPDGASAVELSVGSEIPAALQPAGNQLLIRWSDDSVVKADVIRRKKHKAPRERQAPD